MHWLTELLKLWASFLVGFGLLLGGSGCITDQAMAKATDPIVHVGDRAFDTLDKGIDKGLAELSTQHLSLMGGAQFLVPGWDISVEGLLVNGFKGQATVKAIGLAGQFQSSTGAIPNDRFAPPPEPGATEDKEKISGAATPSPG